MPRNTEGEFELVLGNKQLLSLFFLVAVLFAVFFSLGYMVGKSVGMAPTQAAQGPAPAAPASSLARLPSPLPDSLPAGTSGGPEKAPLTVTETQPAQSGAVGPSSEKTTVPPASRPASETPAGGETAGARSPAASEDNAALATRGIHLQLAAVRVREDAEVLVESLHKKGYRVLLNSQTRDGWYRVVAGPFPNERSAKEMQAELEKDGYKSILKKP